MSRFLLLIPLICVLAMAPLVHADSNEAAMSGSWTWNQTRPDGKVITIVLTCRQEDQKLSGTFHGEGPDSDIYDGTINGHDLKFSVHRTVSGHQVTMTYSGALQGDTIRGNVKMKAGFRERNADWTAKRVAEQGH
jgi:hypothetical protein